MSKDGSLVAVDGWTHVNPFFWAPFLPVLDVRIISFVHLASNEGAPQTPDAVQQTKVRCHRSPMIESNGMSAGKSSEPVRVADNHYVVAHWIEDGTNVPL